MGTGWRATAARVTRGVLRRVAASAPTSRPGSPSPAIDLTPAEREAARVDEALAVLHGLESTVGVVPSRDEPVPFLALGRAVRRPALSPSLTHILPPRLRGEWTELEGVHELDLALAADAVVLAKYDLASRVKLRAGYAEQALAVAVHPDRGDGASGATRAARAAEVVARHAPGLAPAMHDSGTLPGGYLYLVEAWVDGEPLASDRRLAEELPDLLAGLARVQQGYGVQARPASGLWPRFAEQWAAVREAGLVEPEVDAAVVALIEQDRPVRVSWTHGDLAPSNVLATGSGLVVIDWEQAAERPVMFDGARLQLFASRPVRTRDLLETLWDHGQVPGGYRPAEELALLHARFLCDAPRRLERMAGHRREAVYTRQLRRQTAILTQLVTSD